ncbi:hypothetical protein [Pararhizobium sp.]|uniref:hypothetical protein n=1 Tax=Pararhizobium sp. TaxID=1977563 RepID=UPI0027241A35|nr:hypothetical protein [Pararhizobium sp.]MDO9417614.1 hypothetical protein [Pararhizobium sp.]
MQMMGAAAALAFALSTGLFFGTAEAQTPQVPKGRYCGDLVSGGSSVKVETEFSIAPDGHLAGRYTFADGEGETSGWLIEADASEGLLKRLRWADKYGAGRLVISFSADYSSFSGLWAAKEAQPSEAWNGRRCGESTA